MCDTLRFTLIVRYIIFYIYYFIVNNMYMPVIMCHVVFNFF